MTIYDAHARRRPTSRSPRARHAARVGFALAAGLAVFALSAPSPAAEGDPSSPPELAHGAGSTPLEALRGRSSVRLSADLPLRREPSQALAVGRAPALVVLAAIMLVFVGGALLRRQGRAVGRGPAVAVRLASWLRTLSPAEPKRTLRVLQSARLTARASVHVLQWDGREWLVGCSEQGMTVMGRCEAARGTGIANEAQRSAGLETVSEMEK